MLVVLLQNVFGNGHPNSPGHSNVRRRTDTTRSSTDHAVASSTIVVFRRSKPPTVATFWSGARVLKDIVGPGVWTDARRSDGSGGKPGTVPVESHDQLTGIHRQSMS